MINFGGNSCVGFLINNYMLSSPTAAVITLIQLKAITQPEVHKFSECYQKFNFFRMQEINPQVIIHFNSFVVNSEVNIPSCACQLINVICLMLFCWSFEEICKQCSSLCIISNPSKTDICALDKEAIPEVSNEARWTYTWLKKLCSYGWNIKLVVSEVSLETWSHKYSKLHT